MANKSTAHRIEVWAERDSGGTRSLGVFYNWKAPLIFTHLYRHRQISICHFWEPRHGRVIQVRIGKRIAVTKTEETRPVIKIEKHTPSSRPTKLADIPNGFFLAATGVLWFKNEAVAVPIDPQVDTLRVIHVEKEGRTATWYNPIPVDVRIVTEDKR